MIPKGWGRMPICISSPLAREPTDILNKLENQNMIKPTDVDFKTHFDPERMALLEESFDSAIRLAEIAGQWPAIVGHKRDMSTAAEIKATIEKYRDAGWDVTTSNQHRAIIAPRTPTAA